MGTRSAEEGKARDNTILTAGRTALARSQPSVPARKLVEDGWLKRGDMIFDWGCGRGKDLEYFREQGFICGGYDILHRPYPWPHSSMLKYNWLLCAYVLNVIGPNMRGPCLEDIYNFLPDGARAMFAVRAEKEVLREVKDTWIAKYDGWLTSTGTFQKGFIAKELAGLLTDNGFGQIEALLHDPIIVIAHKY